MWDILVIDQGTEKAKCKSALRYTVYVDLSVLNLVIIIMIMMIMMRKRRRRRRRMAGRGEGYSWTGYYHALFESDVRICTSLDMASARDLQLE